MSPACAAGRSSSVSGTQPSLRNTTIPQVYDSENPTTKLSPLATFSTSSNHLELDNEFQRPQDWIDDAIASEVLNSDTPGFDSFALWNEAEIIEDTWQSDCMYFDQYSNNIVDSDWNVNSVLNESVSHQENFQAIKCVDHGMVRQDNHTALNDALGFHIADPDMIPRHYSTNMSAEGGYQNLFETFEEAISYVQRSKHNEHVGDSKPEEDFSVVQIETNCQYFVRMIYIAMVNIEGVWDRNPVIIKHFDPKEPRYEPEELEATAWMIVQGVIDLHKKGRTFHRRWDKSHRILQHVKAADVSLTCAERLEEVRTLLAQSKSTVETAIEGNTRFINHPRYYRQTLQKSRSGNKSIPVTERPDRVGDHEKELGTLN